MRNSQLIEDLFHPFAHDRLRQGEVLHGKYQFILDGVHHELGFRILKDEPNQVRHAAGLGGDRITPGDAHLSAETSAVKMRHQPIQTAQEGRLTGAGRTDDQHEFALADRQGEIPQNRFDLLRIGVGDVVKGNHRILSLSHATLRRSRRGTSKAATTSSANTAPNSGSNAGHGA